MMMRYPQNKGLRKAIENLCGTIDDVLVDAYGIYKIKEISALEIFGFLETIGYAEKRGEDFYIKAIDKSQAGYILGFTINESIDFCTNNPQINKRVIENKQDIAKQFYYQGNKGFPDTLETPATKDKNRIYDKLPAKIQNRLKKELSLSLT